MSEPRKIEWVKYTGKQPYMCRGYLVVNIDGKETTFGGYSTKVSGTDYPQFWDCSKWQDERNDWSFDWDLGEKDFADFSAEEKALLEKLWTENAPQKECSLCVED